MHKTPKYVDSGVPFVTVRNLTHGAGISFDNLKYITTEDHLEYIKRTHPERNDILITKDGTIGVVRLIDTDVVFSIFVSVALIKPALPSISQYLSIAISSAALQTQIVPKGAALKHLYLADLRELWVPIPPKEEQDRIVNQYQKLNTETAALSSQITQKILLLSELKQSILHKAFTGELTADPASTDRALSEAMHRMRGFFVLRTSTTYLGFLTTACMLVQARR